MLESEIQEIEDNILKLYDSDGINSKQIDELFDKLEELYAEKYNGPRIVE